MRAALMTTRAMFCQLVSEETLVPPNLRTTQEEDARATDSGRMATRPACGTSTGVKRKAILARPYPRADRVASVT